MNKFKEENDEVKAEAAAPAKKKKKSRRPIQEVLGGDYLSKEIVVRSLPYIIFVALLALVYISNTYYSEKTLKEIERTKVQLKELRYGYITAKSSLMYYSKQTEIAKRAMKYGLKETLIPPYKIFYTRDTIPGSENKSTPVK